MGQSLSQLYVHLTYGTKNRYPFIEEKYSERLHAYMAGILKKYESPAIIINSVSDHIHILFRLSKNYALAKIVEEIKKNSSKWVKEENKKYQKFAWQSGYGAFSVSNSVLENTKNYILNQKQHHGKISYQQEIEELVKQYDIIEYDQEYFWR